MTETTSRHQGVKNTKTMGRTQWGQPHQDIKIVTKTQWGQPEP